MTQTILQQIITIGLCALATMTTRFLPFLVFREKKETPAYITYLGKYLPSAVFGMLVIYCLKDVTIVSGNHALPEAISILVTIGVHLWRKSFMLSILAGTLCYMLLIHFVFL